MNSKSFICILSLAMSVVHGEFLKKTCTSHEVCDNHFKGAMCHFQDAHERGPRFCVCPPRTVPSDDGKTCVKRVNMLYLNCTQDSQCARLNAICENGRCQCNRFTYYKKNHHTNYTTESCKKNDYEFYCTPLHNGDCHQTVPVANCGWNHVVPAARANRTICQCGMIDGDKMLKCEPIRPKLNEPCREDSECRNSLVQPRGVCRGGTCKCSKYSHEGKNGVCLKTLRYGQICHNQYGFERLAECYQPSKNGKNMLTCGVKDKCVCIPGHVYRNGTCAARSEPKLAVPRKTVRIMDP